MTKMDLCLEKISSNTNINHFFPLSFKLTINKKYSILSLEIKNVTGYIEDEYILKY